MQIRRYVRCAPLQRRAKTCVHKDTIRRLLSRYDPFLGPKFRPGGGFFLCVNFWVLDCACLLFPKAFVYFNGTRNSISWIGHFSRMNSERKVSQVLTTILGQVY